mmetsp:Transcript_29837/g.67620  ORF Transcript_29837/g.67620 Transcript_29837/m.67620 type:complete len:397 (-) Transcript_29837:252-1442(-)
MQGAFKWLDEGSQTDGMSSMITIPPPEVEPREFYGQAPPGQLLLRVCGMPGQVLGALGAFFEAGVAAVVEQPASQAWDVRATVYQDYMPLGVLASVCRDGDREDSTALIFQHRPCTDMVGFGQVVALATKHIEASGLRTLPSKQPSASRTILADDWDDGFGDDFADAAPTASWAQQADAVFRSVASTQRTIREQGLQALAKLAETKPDSRPTLAHALTAHRHVMMTILQSEDGRTSALYPLACTLKFITQHPDARTLPGPNICLAMWPCANLEPIIVKPLREAVANIRQEAAKMELAAKACGEDAGRPTCPPMEYMSFGDNTTACPPSFMAGSLIDDERTSLHMFRRSDSLATYSMAGAHDEFDNMAHMTFGGGAMPRGSLRSYSSAYPAEPPDLS